MYVKLTIHAFREVYDLNSYDDDVQKVIEENGVELYFHLNYGIGYIEIEAPTRHDLERLDKTSLAKLINYCEKYNITSHFFGPLEIY